MTQHYATLQHYDTSNHYNIMTKLFATLQHYNTLNHYNTMTQPTDRKSSRFLQVGSDYVHKGNPGVSLWKKMEVLHLNWRHRISDLVKVAEFESLWKLFATKKNKDNKEVVFFSSKKLPQFRLSHFFAKVWGVQHLSQRLYWFNLSEVWGPSKT